MAAPLMDKFALAKALVLRCERELVKRGPGARDLAVTVIVSSADPLAGDQEFALYSSLDNRRQLRPLLANWIATTLVEEGASPDSVGKAAADEAAALFGRKEGT